MTPELPPDGGSDGECAVIEWKQCPDGNWYPLYWENSCGDVLGFDFCTQEWLTEVPDCPPCDFEAQPGTPPEVPGGPGEGGPVGSPDGVDHWFDENFGWLLVYLDSVEATGGSLGMYVSYSDHWELVPIFPWDQSGGSGRSSAEFIGLTPSAYSINQEVRGALTWAVRFWLYFLVIVWYIKGIASLAGINMWSKSSD